MKKNFNFVVLLIFIFVLIIGIFIYLYFDNNKEPSVENDNSKYNARYEEIKKDINLELERYIYLRWPTCDPQYNPSQRISDGELIYNGGMDKEKFLDVDKEGYCDSFTYATCVEKNKWEFETHIRCKDYMDNKFVDWDK